MQFFFGSAGPESQYASQSASERMGSFGTELQQAVVSWCSLLFARSCIHDTMCVSALAEVLEARALKSSAQTKVPGNTPRAKARPSHDGRRGLQRQPWSGMVGVDRISSDGKAEPFSLFGARRSSREVPQV